ncbi:MAG: PDZ domain-containing protein [Gemmatimonadales bacterium]
MGRLLALLSTLTTLATTGIAAQGGPIPMPLGDGRIALLGAGPSGPRVLAVLRPESGGHRAVDETPTNLAPDDRILSFAGTESPSLDAIRAGFEATKAGATIELEVERAGKPVRVRFTRPEGSMGQMSMRASSGQAASGPAQGWVSAESGNGAALSIAGFSIRADEAGRPVVGFRGSHPAAGTVALEPGDEIRAIGGQTVTTLTELVTRYDAIAEGSSVTLDLVRGGAARRISFAKPAP